MNLKMNNLLSLLMVFAVVFFASCSDNTDENTDLADKATLSATITEAETLLAETEEGTKEGNYLAGSQEELLAVVEIAKTVNAKEDASQTEVDNMNKQLEEAIAVYETKIIEPIAPDALVAHFSFDEGEGTTVSDEAGVMIGEFKVGAQANGAGEPVWAADRHGNEGKAIAFNNGANIQVPYSTALNPGATGQITISLWAKADEIFENNYMVSLDRWDGYKFQLQSVNKAFFTCRAMNEGAEAYYDRDNESPELDVDVWYHVTVTFGEGHMKFYLNGTLVKDWDNTPGTLDNLKETRDLIFGQQMATDLIESGAIEWADNAFFKGTMDEIRIYNTVLTEAQVSAIYEIEK